MTQGTGRAAWVPGDDWVNDWGGGGHAGEAP